MSQKISRQDIFLQAAKRLRTEFEELAVVPHNAVKGHEAEQLIRKFLEEHIPKRFSVGSGFILDPKGEVSRQTDVIIYDAYNCPVYRASEEAAIFPSNNVAVAIEVKSNLDKESLTDAWKKIESIKSLSKHKAEVKGPYKAQTVGFLFAFNTKLKLTTIADHYANLFRERGIGRHIDAIAILDKGILTLAAHFPGVDGWNMAFLEGFGGDKAEGSHIAVSAGQTGEYTLDAFLRLLLPHLEMFRPIIDHPGFSFSDFPVQVKEQALTYLTSITTETDPIKKKEKLEKYAKQVTEMFNNAPMPDDWEK